MVNVRRLRDGSTLYYDAQGVNQVHDLGQGVALHVRRGIMSGAFAKHVMEDGERHIRASGRFVLMVDGVETRIHTTEFREKMTAWFRAHETATVHMLIRSRLVEMALNVANLVMGNTRANTYFNVETWESVGRKHVPSFARRPLTLPEDVRVA
jgi:hypothetical protein